MGELVRVRKKAQVTLPRSVRQALKIEEGDYLTLEVRGDSAVLQLTKKTEGIARPLFRPLPGQELSDRPGLGATRIHRCDGPSTREEMPCIPERHGLPRPLKEIGLKP